MIEEKLKKISEKLNCNYIQENTKYYTASGTNFSVTCHSLEIQYRNAIIKANFEFGNQNISEICANIELKEIKASFEISTHSHLKRLFIKNNSPWKIKSSDPALKESLLRLLEASALNKVAKETSFEPIIKGGLIKNKYEIFARFSLAFERKGESIFPMIILYQNLIDLFQK